ncbi:MAG: hypothetical protein ABJB74_17675 [Gemmatimonas sp.]
MSPRNHSLLLHWCLIAAITTATALVGLPLSAQQSALRNPARPKLRTNPDLITAEQLRSHPDLPTAYRAVEALHSGWMLERGVRPQPGRRVPEGARSVAGENGGVQVYLDGHRLGGTELLRNIPTTGLYAIRHLNGVAAQARFGVGHSEGVIWIATNPAWDKSW